MGRDYYTVLGVSRDADASDLKKAYHKAAITWHPDKWASASEPERKAAESRFKDLADAYAVLSDRDKRAVFDRHGEEGLQAGSASGAHNSGTGFRFNGNPQDVFTQLFGSLGGGRGRAYRQRVSMPEREYYVTCSLEDLYRGKLKKMKVKFLP